jgi:hypothetical protein
MDEEICKCRILIYSLKYSVFISGFGIKTSAIITANILKHLHCAKDHAKECPSMFFLSSQQSRGEGTAIAGLSEVSFSERCSLA